MSNHWTEHELDLLMTEYLQLLRSELRGEPISKVGARNRLMTQITRSKGSIEYKFANVSAVLRDLGYPFVNGYKPYSNYQASMKPQIRTIMASSGISPLASPVNLDTAAE